MAMVRYQQQGPVRVDRGNLLGAKVIECLPLGAQATALVSGRRLTIGSGAQQGISPRGYHLRGVGSGTRANIALDLSAYNKITIAFWLNWDVYPGTDTALAMEFGPTYSGVNGFIVDPNNASPQAFMFGCGGSGGSNLVTFPRPSSGVWHRLVLTFDRTAAVGAAGQAYVDGVAQSMSAFSGSSITPGNFASSTLHLLSRNSASLFSTAGIELLTIYSGILSPQEVSEDARNPYQIFADASDEYEMPQSPSGITGIFSGSTAFAMGGTGQLANIGSMSPFLSDSGMVASGLSGTPPSGAMAPILAGASMLSNGTQTNAGTIISLLDGTSMLGSGAIASPASGAFSLALTGATMNASGYQGAQAPRATTIYRRRAPHRLAN